MEEVDHAYQEKLHVRELVAVLNKLPIDERLKIVRELLFKRYGSTFSLPVEGTIMPKDYLMAGAVEILDGVIEAVRRNPKKAGQRRLKL